MSLKIYVQYILFIYLSLNSVNANVFFWKTAYMDSQAMGRELLNYNLTEVKCSNCIETAKARWTSKQMFNYLQGERVCRHKVADKLFKDTHDMSKDMDDENIKSNHNNQVNKPVMSYEEFQRYFSECLDGYNIEPEWQMMLIDNLQMLEMFCINNGTCRRNYESDKSEFLSVNYINNLKIADDYPVHKGHQLVQGYNQMFGFKSLDEVDKLNLDDHDCKKCLDSTKQRWNNSLEINQAYHLERLCRLQAISKHVYRPKGSCTLIHHILDDIKECLDENGISEDDQLLIRLYGFADQFCLNKGLCKSSYVNPNHGDKLDEPSRQVLEEQCNWRFVGPPSHPELKNYVIEVKTY